MERSGADSGDLKQGGGVFAKRALWTELWMPGCMNGHFFDEFPIRKKMDSSFGGEATLESICLLPPSLVISSDPG